MLFVFAVSAQSVKIEGTIKDKATNKGISFVNIRFKNNYTGTASNEAGAFVFKVPKNYLQDSIIFSCVGYKKMVLPVNKALQSKVIYLEQEAKMLSVVTLSPLSAEEILRDAIERIPQNYHNPASGTYFYRDWRKLEDTLYVFAECILDILRTPYGGNTKTGKKQDTAYSIVKKQRLLLYDSLLVQKSDTTIVSDQYFLSHFMDVSSLELLTFSEEVLKRLKKSNFTLSSFYDEEGTLFYIIEQQLQKPKYKYLYSVARFTINTLDHAITRIETSEKIKENLKLLGIPTSGFHQINDCRHDNHYEKVNGKYILTFASYFDDGEVGDYSKKYSRRYKLNVVYQLTSFNTAIESFPKEQAIPPHLRKFSDIFTNNSKDESFWEQYNYIPLEESIKNEIGK